VKAERIASRSPRPSADGSGAAGLAAPESQSVGLDAAGVAVAAPDEALSAPERQPVEADSAAGRCRRCGGPIRGDRRNGFCGDACRMRVYREDLAQKRRALIDHLKQAVHDVERELLGEADHER
jgi:hypothetical protein